MGMQDYEAVVPALVEFRDGAQFTEASIEWPKWESTYDLHVGSFITIELDDQFPVRPYLIRVGKGWGEADQKLLGEYIGLALVKCILESEHDRFSTSELRLNGASRLWMVNAQIYSPNTPPRLKEVCRKMLNTHAAEINGEEPKT